MSHLSVTSVLRVLSLGGRILLRTAPVFVLSLCTLAAQAPNAMLNGVVSDQSGAVVPNIDLTLSDAATGVQRRAVSNDQGAYVFAGLPPGTYVLLAGGNGFAPVRIERITLAASDQRSLAVTLQVAAVTDAVTVRGGVISETNSAAGTKTDTPLIETPRSISVISAARIDQQRANNIDEVLRYAAGVSSEFRGIDRSRTDISLRGFNWAGFVFTDGMRGGVGGYGEFDVEPFGLERVEILRGPASILYGASSPGGLINVVTKRPTDTFTAEAGLNLGSFNQFGGRFDVGGPVNDGKTVLFRLTGLAHGGDSQVDVVRDERLFLAPALTWRPRSGTDLTVLATYQKDDAPWAIFLPAEGTVLPNPHGRVPTSRHLGETDFVDQFHRQFFTSGYILEQRIGRATLHHGLRYGDYDFHALSVSGGEFDEDLRTVHRYPWVGNEGGHSLTTDTNIRTTMEAGPSRHTLLFGLDYKRSWASEAYGFDEGPPLDIFAPVYGDHLSADVPLYQDDEQDAFQTGAYLQDQVRIGKWAVTVGGRYDKSGSETLDRMSESTVVQRDGAFTGQAGVVYLADNGLAPFANYATSFEPQSGTDAAGHPFVPTTGTQYEAGVKYEHTRLNTLITGSVFVIAQQNVPTSDPADPRFNVQTGEIRSRGFDVEVKTTPTRDVSVTAAVGFAGVEVTKSNGEDLGRRPAQVPRTQLSVWADYAVRQSLLRGMTVGGGIRRTSSSLDYDNLIEVPPVTLVDFVLRYDFLTSLKGPGLAVNVSNLLDKSYVSSCEGLYWCMYGPRRTVTVSAHYRW